jgi:hypothetical protein
VGQMFDAAIGIGLLLALLASPFFVIKGLRGLDRKSAKANTRRLAAEHARTTTGVPGKPERSFLKSCTNCRAFALTLPYRDNLGRTYCSEDCMRWLGEGPRSFCKKCTFETTAKSSGNLQTINGIGTRFAGRAEQCSECGSVIRRVWVSLLYLPVIPLAKYRVIRISPQQFLSRKLRA